MTEDVILGLIYQELIKLVLFAKIADDRGRAIAEMWEKIDQKQRSESITITQIPPQTILHESAPVDDKRSYDWWRLENGAYAKVYRTVLEGEVYQEDGKRLCVTTWNPLNMNCLQNDLSRHWDLKNRKTGDNPQGWPDWCK